MFPNLFIPGAAKSGTTSLFDYLSNHKDVCMTLTKEPHYLCRPDKTVKDYNVAFPSDVSNYKYRGEASNMYMILPEVALEIKKVSPEAKIIFILRNPVNRAWSHYRWQKFNYGNENRSFQEAFISDVTGSISKKDAISSANIHYYQNGCYGSYVNEYYKIFGHENVLILEFEEFRGFPVSVLNRVSEFLEISEFELGDKIVSNPTVARKWPFIFKFHARLTRYVGNLTKSYISDDFYRAARSFNQIAIRQVHNYLSSPVSEDARMHELDRELLIKYYKGQVNDLRRITGLEFHSWDKDFPLDTKF